MEIDKILHVTCIFVHGKATKHVKPDMIDVQPEGHGRYSNWCVVV